VKMAAFWDIALCSLVEVVPLKRLSTLARLHEAISQKAVMFVTMFTRTY
jgi:hypothetical protein